MNLTLRTIVAGTSLTSLLAAGLTAYPAFAADAGLDFWQVPALRTQIDESERESQELDRRSERDVRRTAARVETVEGVLAGRIAAEDAVQTFATLNRSDARTMAQVRRQYPGGTDEERAGAQLVAHLRAFPHPRAAAVADEAARRLAGG